MSAVKEGHAESHVHRVARLAWTTPTVTQIGVIAKIDVPRAIASGNADSADPPFAVRRHRIELVRRDRANHP